MRHAEERLYGVDGWLLVLVMWLLLVNPVLSPIVNWAEIRATEQQYPALLADLYWRDVVNASWLQQAIAVAASLFGGLVLLKSRRPSAVHIVIALLWTAGPVLIILLMIFVASAHDVRLEASVVLEALKPSAATVGWTAYLLVSRRVRNTYGLAVR